MIDNEVNKIIAEFMGCTQKTYKCSKDKLMVQDYIELKWHDTGLKTYTKSLDTLVPVWEKLKVNQVRLGDSYGFDQCQILKGIDPVTWCDGNTIQQAAAHVTAKAILELKEKQ